MINKHSSLRSQTLKEGTRVCSDSLPVDIITHIKGVLAPSLHKLWTGFKFNFDALVVREEATFTDLANPSISPLLPYFDKRFITIRPKDKVEVFKPPKKPIEFLLIIDSEQWEAAEDFLDLAYTQRQAPSYASQISSVCSHFMILSSTLIARLFRYTNPMIIL